MHTEQNPTQKIKRQQAYISVLTNKETAKITDGDLMRVYEELRKNGLAYAIFMYANQLLDPLIASPTKQKYPIMSLFKLCVPGCLYQLKPIKATKAKHNNFEKQKQFEELYEAEKKKDTIKKSGREDEIGKFLESVVLAVRDGSPKDIASAIEIGFYLKGLEIEKKNNFTPYEQYSINYLNFCLQSIRSSNQQKNICCKTIFLQKQHISSGEGPSQEFKRYIWPINNINIKNHLTKTIVGFMNCKGGIIFIGIMENKEKKNQVVGIQLKPTDVKPITDLFNNQLVAGIHPKHEGFNNQKNGPVGSLVRNQFQINKYVKMEFTRVVDPNTFMNVEIWKQGKYEASLYIVKVVVKIGHPKHLYHIINTEKNIDFFQRKDRNVQKMQFPQAYSTIYKRLDQFEIFKHRYRAEQQQYLKLPQKDRQYTTIQQYHTESIKTLGRQLFHSNCRYVMDNIQWLLKDDVTQDSDDDDDDE